MWLPTRRRAAIYSGDIGHRLSAPALPYECDITSDQDTEVVLPGHGTLFLADRVEKPGKPGSRSSCRDHTGDLDPGGVAEDLVAQREACAFLFLSRQGQEDKGGRNGLPCLVVRLRPRISRRGRTLPRTEPSPLRPGCRPRRSPGGRRRRPGRQPSRGSCGRSGSR